MNKMLVKILSVCFAFTILLTGGAFLLNQDALAATAKKPTISNTKDAVTTKVCAHTTIKTIAKSVREENCGICTNLEGTFEILLTTKKGNSEHIHKQVVNYEHRPFGASTGVQDNTYTKNGSTVVTGLSNLQHLREFFEDTNKWTGTYQSTTTKKTTLKKQYKCSYCQLQMSASDKNVTLKTKCCGDTVKLNIYTGEAVVYRKGKTVPSKDIGSFLKDVQYRRMKHDENGIPYDNTEICAHTTIKRGQDFTYEATYLNNKVKNVKGRVVLAVETKKGKYSHEHAQSWFFDGANFTKAFLNCGMCEMAYTKNNETETCGVSEFTLTNGKKPTSKYESTTMRANGKKSDTELNLSQQWCCSNCKLRRSATGQTAIITTKCCGDTVKINLRTGKITVV